MDVTDISALLISALVGGLIGYALKLVDHRREDRYRWAADLRVAYAEHIDAIGECLGTCAALEAYLEVGEGFPDNELLKTEVGRLSEEAFDHWLRALPSHGVIQLLGSTAGVDALKVFDKHVQKITNDLVLAKISPAVPKFAAHRAAAVTALEVFTDAARQDIGVR